MVVDDFILSSTLCIIYVYKCIYVYKMYMYVICVLYKIYMHMCSYTQTLYSIFLNKLTI